ncbi:unnamed protein product [Closterium sp. NIES-65]|nr:unnamed protein product [Closterium sp. NIES-65]
MDPGSLSAGGARQPRTGSEQRAAQDMRMWIERASNPKMDEWLSQLRITFLLLHFPPSIPLQLEQCLRHHSFFLSPVAAPPLSLHFPFKSSPAHLCPSPQPVPLAGKKSNSSGTTPLSTSRFISFPCPLVATLDHPSISLQVASSSPPPVPRAVRKSSSSGTTPLCLPLTAFCPSPPSLPLQVVSSSPPPVPRAVRKSSSSGTTPLCLPLTAFCPSPPLPLQVVSSSPPPVPCAVRKSSSSGTTPPLHSADRPPLHPTGEESENMFREEGGEEGVDDDEEEESEVVRGSWRNDRRGAADVMTHRSMYDESMQPLK